MAGYSEISDKHPCTCAGMLVRNCEKRPLRGYQDPVLWAWLEHFSPNAVPILKHILSPEIFFFAQWPKGYSKTFHCGPFEAEHPMRYQKHSFNS